jgi:GNAT superfamily N-acetyltransferase
VDSVLGIMRDAAIWLEDSGIDQWRVILTPTFLQVVQDRIKGGVAYLASFKGEDIGTITIQFDDPYSWGEKGKDGLAGYIRGMAVLRKHSGKGIGREMLNWGMAVIRERRPFVRLDCMAENHRLCRYYEDLGFQSQGQKTLDNGLRTNLYEKN